jgi:hypothetical protein
MTKKEFDSQSVGKGDKIKVQGIFQKNYWCIVTGVDWKRRVYFSGSYETDYDKVIEYVPNPKFKTP